MQEHLSVRASLLCTEENHGNGVVCYISFLLEKRKKCADSILNFNLKATTTNLSSVGPFQNKAAEAWNDNTSFKSHVIWKEKRFCCSASVVLNLFYISYPFIKQDYLIYPQYAQWFSFIENTKLTNSYSLEWFIKIYICCNLWFSKFISFEDKIHPRLRTTLLLKHHLLEQQTFARICTFLPTTILRYFLLSMFHSVK